MDEEWVAERISEVRPLLGTEQRQAERQKGEQAAAEQLSQATTLKDLSDDGVVLFTPALLTTHGGFDRDPVIEFVRTVTTTDPADLPFTIDSEYKLFAGLGLGVLNGQLVNWDNRLYGIPEQHWPQLRDMLMGICWYDTRRYNFGRVCLYELLIVDQHALRSGELQKDIPTVAVQVFGASTLRGLYYLAPATDPPRTYPTVQRNAPEEALVVEAQAVLGPPPNPSAILKGEKRESED